MNQVLNLFITLIIMASMGITCLFLLLLADYKHEIWNCLVFESEEE